MARGFKSGGRVAGIPNKKTIIESMVKEALETPAGREAVHAAVQRLAQPPKGTKKALDMLRELAVVSHALVVINQPKKDQAGNVTVENHDRLVQCLGVAVRAASELASFESPKFKSVTVPEIPPLPPEKADEGAKVTSSMRKRTQQDAADVYMRLVRGAAAKG